MKPLVSVLTTVYNREKYLADCIESVLASTYDNWELIIVDDQSRDRSVEIAESYADKDERIKVFINEINLGDYPNRNKAASLARGKYIKYLDADDYIFPECLEVMVSTMEKFPEAALGVSQKVEEDPLEYPFSLTPKESIYREFINRGVLGFGPTHSIIRLDVFNNFGGFSGEQYIGDTELWYRLALDYPVVKIKPGLVFWREHEDQQIVFESKDISVLKKRYLNQRNTLFKARHLLTNDEFEFANNKLRYLYSRTILRVALKQGNIKGAFSLFRNTDVGLGQVLMSLRKGDKFIHFKMND